MSHTGFTKEGFAEFRANDRPGPIHMLNLVRLRDRAEYPDGRAATGAEPMPPMAGAANLCCDGWAGASCGAVRWSRC